MPAWVEKRKDHILQKNPDMPESEAWAIAYQQGHKLGKTKGWQTRKGVQEAKKKYRKPKSEYEQTANSEKTAMISISSFSDELQKIAIAPMGALASKTSRSAAAVGKVKLTAGTARAVAKDSKDIKGYSNIGKKVKKGTGKGAGKVKEEADEALDHWDKYKGYYGAGAAGAGGLLLGGALARRD